MLSTSKKLPKSQAEITIEVAADEVRPYLEKASQRISQEAKIAGFRPGKAPYEMIKQKFGEMAIYQEALDFIIKDTLFKAFEQEKLEVIGQPKIDVDKLAPGNPVIYRATVDLLPKAKMKEYKGLKVKAKKIEVGEEKVRKTLEQLQKMRASESLQDKAIEMGDKAVIDFSVYLDKVAIDGGDHKHYPIYLGENFFVPGFEENLIGMKKGEEKEFKQKFPKDYFQKHLADKMTDVKVKVKDVFKVEKPELNDEFAKMINFENVAELTEQIKKNIEQEEKFQEDQRLEAEIFDKIIEKSEFDEFPQILIEGELDKMISELKSNVERQGAGFEDYLNNIKTTVDDLRKSFVSQAEKRLQTSLVLREIALLEQINATKEDIEKEIEQLLKMYNNPESEKIVRSDDYKSYLENLLANRKTVEKLREWNIEE